ncbi:hypothetical protein F5Y06DRAFT_259793 [Hypoxylon sp. FL0890]|nr:hypothetical protein F5Y06DRAFT_259793 [Hypoxylon sp. FL0890]
MLVVFSTVTVGVVVSVSVLVYSGEDTGVEDERNSVTVMVGKADVPERLAVMASVPAVLSTGIPVSEAPTVQLSEDDKVSVTVV